MGIKDLTPSTPACRFLGDRRTQESQPLFNHNRSQSCLLVSTILRAEWRQKLTHHITVPLEIQIPRLLLSHSCRQAPLKDLRAANPFSIGYGFNKPLFSALLPSLLSSFSVSSLVFFSFTPIQQEISTYFLSAALFPPRFMLFCFSPLSPFSHPFPPELLPLALQHICF